jgi:putative membrane protein
MSPEPDPGPDPDGWQRLDVRNLLLDPIKAVGQFLVPAIIALVGLSSRRGELPWWSLPVVVLGAVALGVLPWLTTSWRVTPTQFQKRSGLLNKRTSTAPLDRVRSVDLEASLLHRVLGLAKVQIGTGVDDDRITLDAISRERAAALRSELLARRGGVPLATGGPAQPDGALATEPDASPRPATGASPAAVPAVETQLAAIDWSWLRFAPFSLTRLVLLAGLAGLLAQFADDLPFLDQEHLSSGWRWLTSFAIWLVVVLATLGGLVVWLLVSVTGYVVQWWDLRLTRGQGSLHLAAGLFTTRAISVEETRVRGVELREPLLLRVVGGGELSTLATGVGSGGVTRILPPCPRPVCVAVGDDVLAAPGRLTVPLHPHGPAARRRSHLRRARGTLALAALTVLPVVLTDVSWLGWWLPVAVLVVGLPLGAALAEAAYRNLGHALVVAPDPHLVVGDAEVARVRTVLEADGVIGWVLTETWFQRRVGLVDLAATTAAGAERVVVRDVPRETAIRLADRTTPGVLTAWSA